MAKEYESKLDGLDSSASGIPASAFDPGGAFASTVRGSSAAELAPMASQDSQIFDQYFQPLYNKYGLDQQSLVKAYQSGGLGQTGDNLLVNQTNYKNAIIHPNTWMDTLAQTLALTGTVGLATAGIGSYIGPLLGAALGDTAGAIATGAAAGAAGGAFQDTLTEGGKNIGSATGKGALSGAIGGAVAPASSALSSSTGINPTLATGLVKTGAGAAVGAGSAALSGGNVGSAASSGAVGGASGAAQGAVAGSIFNSGSTINQSITNQNNPNMTIGSTNYDYGYDPSTLGDISPSTYDAFDSSGGMDFGGIDPSTLGNIDPSTFDALDPNGSTMQGLYGQANQDASQYGGSAGGLGGAAGSAGLSGLLKALFGGGSSGGGTAGGSSSLLASLLGGGLNTAAGALNSSAAKGAASQYANQTAYNPYSVTTSNGTAGFNGTNAFSALSPNAQANQNSLNGLTQQSANNLVAGPQAASQNYYNQLQASQSDANNKMYQNNLDSQFGKGILASTAGQYQSQAALNNISQQGLNDQVLANQFGQNQQQQQLSQLTAGLNGLNQSQSNQLQQIQAGGNLGSNAGNINLNAYKPSVAANANSTFGGILGSLGSQGTSNGLASLLQALGGGS